MKTVSVLLITVGLGLIFYLGVGYFNEQRVTKQLLESYMNIPFEQLNTLNNEGAPMIIGSDRGPLPNEKGVWGILTIAEIDLIVPIVEGAGANELKNAVGHIPQSGSLAGIGDNFAIAGHRSYIFGQFFSRLDELEKEHIISITTKENVFRFRIVSKEIVDPSNISVLASVRDKSLVTLITCHPAHSNKQRLVLRAEKMEDT